LAETDVSTRPLFAYRQGGLEMDGVAIGGLIERHATPFFLLSERRLLANYRALANGLAASDLEVRLRYCAKANHEAGVLAALAREGSDLLASHLAEVELALACGFPPSRIAYQRPAPPAAEVEAVLAAGVPLLHLFRVEDVAPFARLAERQGRRIDLSLRLREEPRFGLAALPTLSNLNARLGLSLAEAREAAAACRGSRWLRVTALNVYIGTQQAGPNGFDRAIGRACRLARRLASEDLAAIEEINLGGGVPSPSLSRLRPSLLWARWRDRAPASRAAQTGTGDDAPARLETFASQVALRYRRAAERAGLTRPPALGAEPGRSIVGNAAVVVSRVLAAKRGWLFLDASRNFLGESPLLFSRTLLPERDPAAGTGIGERGRRFVHLSGSTLNTLDVLDLHRRLPALGAGDALVFCDAGAYSISRTSRYAGMAPAVLVIGLDGAVRTIRRAETVADLAGPMAPGLEASAGAGGV
jgi:diaminopimelate decarboxylase